MAQILKEKTRNSIIDAAKEEFLEKGYKDASLRNIAKKSGMTVGNLYRYFKNKEDINLQIVGPTLELIENMLSKMTDNKVSFQAHVFNIKMNNTELIETLDKLADEMIDIYADHKIEFNILMMRSKLNDEITEWFGNIVKTLICQNYNVVDNDIEIDSLSKAYAVSIFSGLRHLFLKEKLSYEQLKSIIRVYFRSYVYMLDTDIRVFVGE